MRFTTIGLSLLMLMSRPAFAQDLSKHFDGISGTFVLLNGRTGESVRLERIPIPV